MSYLTKTQIEKVVSCAFDAGKISERFRKDKDFQVMKKPDGSSVTTADITVSELINRRLSEDFSEIPIVCEEGNVRDVDDIFWLIDPIDGTSSFIEGSEEYAINIALIKDREVVFGLIYGPSFEGGKMVYTNHEDRVVLQNSFSQQIALEVKEFKNDKLRIVTSARSKNLDIENYVNQFHKEFKESFVVERLSSAVKFFRIVEDGADLYLHFRKSMEWDTASGQALIEFMGGKVKNLSSNESGFEVDDNILYKKDNFANQPFISFVKKEFSNAQ